MRETNSVAQIQASLLGKGNCLSAQKEALDEVIACLRVRKTPVSNKSIILQIVARLTDETDVHRQETLRVLLQLVVGYTPDDAGF